MFFPLTCDCAVNSCSTRHRMLFFAILTLRLGYSRPCQHRCRVNSSHTSVFSTTASSEAVTLKMSGVHWIRRTLLLCPFKEANCAHCCFSSSTANLISHSSPAWCRTSFQICRGSNILEVVHVNDVNDRRHHPGVILTGRGRNDVYEHIFDHRNNRTSVSLMQSELVTVFTPLSLH